MSERGDGLALFGVSHAFDEHLVIREVALAVGRDEIACLLGPSGCGKTTLLRLAAGLERLRKGTVVIGGRVVADADRGVHVPPEARGVGLMFQDYALFPHLTVLENIAFGVPPGEGKDRVRSMMGRVGIEPLAGAYPHMLSGGEQQRVALLRALAPRPGVLLLDEPFSGLDVTLRTQVREETLDLLKETGIATLIVTHDPEEAMFMADRILVMNSGTIVQAATPREAYFHPADAYVAALFGPINRLEGRVADGKVRTALGCFAAGRLANGTPAQVLIRPEGLELVKAGADDGAAVLDIVSARLIGRSTHVRLHGRPGSAAADVQLHARVLGAFDWPEGAAVGVRIDDRRAFVFPRT